MIQVEQLSHMLVSGRSERIAFFHIFHRDLRFYRPDFQSNIYYEGSQWRYVTQQMSLYELALSKMWLSHRAKYRIWGLSQLFTLRHSFLVNLKEITGIKLILPVWPLKNNVLSFDWLPWWLTAFSIKVSKVMASERKNVEGAVQPSTESQSNDINMLFLTSEYWLVFNKQTDRFPLLCSSLTLSSNSGQYTPETQLAYSVFVFIRFISGVWRPQEFWGNLSEYNRKGVLFPVRCSTEHGGRMGKIHWGQKMPQMQSLTHNSQRIWI